MYSILKTPQKVIAEIAHCCFFIVGALRLSSAKSTACLVFSCIVHIIQSILAIILYIIWKPLENLTFFSSTPSVFFISKRVWCLYSIALNCSRGCVDLLEKETVCNVCVMAFMILLHCHFKTTRNRTISFECCLNSTEFRRYAKEKCARTISERKEKKQHDAINSPAKVIWHKINK